MTRERDRWRVRAAVALVHAYQLTLGPLMGGVCRFTPSCSEYAMAAIRTHGVARGAWLAARRVARCHPLGGHGVDPVPPPTRKQTV